MEKCECHIIFKEGYATLPFGKIVFCPLHAAAPEMQAKLQAAEEMARALRRICAEDLNGLSAACDREAQAALQSWEKAGKGEK